MTEMVNNECLPVYDYESYKDYQYFMCLCVSRMWEVLGVQSAISGGILVGLVGVVDGAPSFMASS